MMSAADSNVSDGFSTAPFATATSSNIGETNITPGLIVLCTFLFAVVAVSAVANLFVLLSYKFEKKLRTTFAILIGNLAVTDLLLSYFPMFFFTINILYIITGRSAASSAASGSSSTTIVSALHHTCWLPYHLIVSGRSSGAFTTVTTIPRRRL